VTVRQPVVSVVAIDALAVGASVFVGADFEAKIPDTLPLEAPPNGGIFSAQSGSTIKRPSSAGVWL